jgi:hypothetical protein
MCRNLQLNQLNRKAIGVCENRRTMDGNCDFNFNHAIKRAMPNAAVAANPPINAVCNPLRIIGVPVNRGP